MIILRQFLKDAWTGANAMAPASMFNLLKLPYREIVSAFAAFWFLFATSLMLVGISAEKYDGDEPSDWWSYFLFWACPGFVIWVVNSAVRWREQNSSKKFDVSIFQPHGMDDEVLTFPYSKTNLMRYAVLFGATFLFGIWLLINAGREMHDPLKLIVSLVCGFVLIGIGGAAALAMRQKLLSDAPGLIIDRDGMTIHPRTPLGIFVPWSEIAQIKRNGRFTETFAREPEKFAPASGYFRKWAFRVSLKRGEATITIWPELLAVQYDQAETDQS